MLLTKLITLTFQRGDAPDKIIDKLCDNYREHIDAAHAWLHASLNLWEKADKEGQVRGAENP